MSRRLRTYRHVDISTASLLSSERKRLMLRNIHLDHLSVGLSVCKGSKTADWIRMPFRGVSGVGRGMGVLDACGDRCGKGAVLG